MTRMTLAERRQKLIAAALAVIARAGVPGATTRAIAAEAGMPLASFHYAFESHQALMADATTVVLDGELARLDALELAGSTPEERLHSLLEAHLADVAARDQDHHRIQELLDHAFRTEGQQQVPGEWRRARVARVAAKLGDGSDDAAASGLADIAVTMCDGLTQAHRLSGDRRAGEQAIAHWTGRHALVS